MRFFEKISTFTKNVQGKRFFSIEWKEKLKKYYQILNVDKNSDYKTVHRSYIDLAKKYHPDSGSPEADANKFQEIQMAFKHVSKKLSQEKAAESQNDDVKTFDIKHTAPQHRQYLSFEGVGIGTPAQREKQYVKVKASRAAQNVMEHRLAKATASENALMDKNKPIVQKKHDIKTQYGFDRLVEDLIQEAMSKGEFDNLRGKGKPLPLHQNTNPYVDFVTHKMNQVLIDNGFTPEWISLQKEIRQLTESLQSGLSAGRNKFGQIPLTPVEEIEWNRCVDKYVDLVKNINSKINHYNLVVPILQKQMLCISLRTESEKILKIKPNIKATEKIDNSQKFNQEEDTNFLKMLFSIFKF